MPGEWGGGHAITDVGFKARKGPQKCRCCKVRKPKQNGLCKKCNKGGR